MEDLRHLTQSTGYVTNLQTSTVFYPGKGSSRFLKDGEEIGPELSQQSGKFLLSNKLLENLFSRFGQFIVSNLIQEKFYIEDELRFIHSSKTLLILGKLSSIKPK